MALPYLSNYGQKNVGLDGKFHVGTRGDLIRSKSAFQRMQAGLRSQPG
jgi:hypothetical protein